MLCQPPSGHTSRGIPSRKARECPQRRETLSICKSAPARKRATQSARAHRARSRTPPVGTPLTVPRTQQPEKQTGSP
nr:MAG TPA: hypothetical protein [Caudoviricetes sp.]